MSTVVDVALDRGADDGLRGPRPSRAARPLHASHYWTGAGELRRDFEAPGPARRLEILVRSANAASLPSALSGSRIDGILIPHRRHRRDTFCSHRAPGANTKRRRVDRVHWVLGSTARGSRTARVQAIYGTSPTTFIVRRLAGGGVRQPAQQPSIRTASAASALRWSAKRKELSRTLMASCLRSGFRRRRRSSSYRGSIVSRRMERAALPEASTPPGGIFTGRAAPAGVTGQSDPRAGHRRQTS